MVVFVTVGVSVLVGVGGSSVGGASVVAITGGGGSVVSTLPGSTGWVRRADTVCAADVANRSGVAPMPGKLQAERIKPAARIKTSVEVFIRVRRLILVSPSF